MPFVKLDTMILDSTLWFDLHARTVFITALLMAEFRQFKDPMQAIEVRSLQPLGYTVPPGWYGWVPAAGIGIVNRALVDKEAGYAALEALASPEAESRSKEHEGRRMVRVDGGYLVLNFAKYREMDHKAKNRAKAWRDRQRELRNKGNDGDTRTLRDERRASHRQKQRREGEVEVRKQIDILSSGEIPVEGTPQTAPTRKPRRTAARSVGFQPGGPSDVPVCGEANAFVREYPGFGDWYIGVEQLVSRYEGQPLAVVGILRQHLTGEGYPRTDPAIVAQAAFEYCERGRPFVSNLFAGFVRQVAERRAGTGGGGQARPASQPATNQTGRVDPRDSTRNDAAIQRWLEQTPDE